MRDFRVQNLLESLGILLFPLEGYLTKKDKGGCTGSKGKNPWTEATIGDCEDIGSMIISLTIYGRISLGTLNQFQFFSKSYSVRLLKNFEPSKTS